METVASLARCREVLEAARAGIAGLEAALFEAGGTELGELVELLDEVSSRASAARSVVIAEAVRRGEPATTLTCWVREHAPSLRQQGAAATSRVVAERTRTRSLSVEGRSGPTSDSPLGIVWEAITATKAQPVGDAAVGDTVVGDAPVGAGRPALMPSVGLAVLSEMRLLAPRLVPEAVPTVTRVLVDLALEWGPAQMRRLRPELLARYGMDGELEDEEHKLASAAFLSSPRVESGGLTEYRMALTPEQAATMEASIDQLSAPRPDKESGERDLRPVGQRRVEALTQVCARALAAMAAAQGSGTAGSGSARSGSGWPGSGSAGSGAIGSGSAGFAAVGSGVALHVTMDLEQLRRITGTNAGDAGAGSARPGDAMASDAGAADLRAADFRAADLRTADSVGRLAAGEVLASRAAGVLLSPEVVRRLACGADLIPYVLGSAGEIVDQGRLVRLFTRAQRRRLILRDRECTFPGCDRPAGWTQAHHLRHWVDGGRSDLDNAALLCQAHHTRVHTRRLWAVVHDQPIPGVGYVEWDLTPGSYDTALARLRHQGPPGEPRLTG